MPGQIAGATITVGVKKDCLAVPASALVDAGEGTVLNVVREGKSVVLHPKLGAQDKHWVEVLDTDLKPREPVIVEGGYALPDKTPVTTEPDKEDKKEPAKDDKKEERKEAEPKSAAQPSPGQRAATTEGAATTETRRARREQMVGGRWHVACSMWFTERYLPPTTYHLPYSRSSPCSSCLRGEIPLWVGTAHPAAKPGEGASS
jgi:hypothetical protein